MALQLVVNWSADEGHHYCVTNWLRSGRTSRRGREDLEV